MTHQSVLERIRSRDDTVRHAAFDDLVSGYWRPCYHYLRLHWRLPAEDAEDIVQGFFAVAFEKDYLNKFDPAQARFRTFLRTCLDRYLQNQWKAGTALKRGGGISVLSLDFPGAEQDVMQLAPLHSGVDDVERFFHDEMVRSLLARTVNDLKAELAAAGKSRAFDVFEHHDLTEAPPGQTRSYRGVAEALGLPVTTVTNDLHLARKRFRALALSHLRALVASDEEFRLEARELFGVDAEPA